MSSKYEQEIKRAGRAVIRSALKKAKGNKAEAARNLGMTYRQYRYRLSTLA